MVHLTVFVCGLLAATLPESEREIKSTTESYEEARARVGPRSDDHVKLALWCEANGLTAERMKHLALAVITDPSNAAARGLLGMASDGRGRWRGPEEIAERECDVAALAEYNARRARTPETAEAQWKLALWCEQVGLKPEAVAHLTVVTRLAPEHAGAWKHLGYKRHGSRWMTPEQIAAEAAEVRAQAKANRVWRPRLERLKGAFASKEQSPRAEAALAAITDPRAVPAVVSVLGSGDRASQRLAVQILGQIDAPAASRALADLAVSSPFDSVCRSATERLRRLDPREFVDRLIDRLVDPLRYHVRPVGGPGESGELLVEGEKADLDRIYAPPPLPSVPVTPGSWFDTDETGALILWVAGVVPDLVRNNSLTPALSQAMRVRNPQLPSMIASLLGPNSGLEAVPFRVNGRTPWLTFPDGSRRSVTAIPIGRMVQEVERAAYEARGQQRDDVRGLEQRNASARKANDRVVLALEAVIGRSMGSYRGEWERWWNDQRGYQLASLSASTKPTVFEQVAPGYTPQPIGQYRFDPGIGYYIPNVDCFVAGTPVRTLAGLSPIESVKVGDRVLAQDAATGTISYQPVVAVHHNPPSATLRVALEGGEMVVTTAIQRLWKARKGWVMARDLKPGDSMRTLGGVARVISVETGSTRPVFNLEVASGHDFFVGSAGALVHDHNLVEPVEKPFDAEPALPPALASIED
jgi:hypothetical protein